MCHVTKTSHKAYPESANTLAACAKLVGGVLTTIKGKSKITTLPGLNMIRSYAIIKP